MDWNRITQRLSVLKGLLRLITFQKKLRKTRKQREVVFVNHVSITEKFLQERYKKLDEYITGMEKKLHEGLIILYSRAKVEMINGVVVLKKQGNGDIKAKMNHFVDAWTHKLSSNLLSDKTIDSLFIPIRKEAKHTVLDNQALLNLSDSLGRKIFGKAEFFVNEGEFNSFRRGYRSNMKAVLYNEPRRMRERIDENFGTGVARNLAIKQVGTLKFNRNVYKLSSITHPRAAYKNILLNNHNKQGFVFYKMVVPKQVGSKLSPFGKTAALLYSIKTVADWNKNATDDTNANTIGGLGLHHGSQEYYYPVMSDEMEEEEAIAKEQRRKLKPQTK